MEIKSSAGPASAGAGGGSPGFQVEPRVVAAALGVVLLVLIAILSTWQAPRPDPIVAVRVLSLDWWLHPVETNALLRLAALDAPLNAVHVAADGRRIWAVGGGGVIVHSDDQGAHWRRESIDFTALGGPAANPAAPSTPKKAAAVGWFERALPAANAQESNAPAQRAAPLPSTKAPPNVADAKSGEGPAPKPAGIGVTVPDLINRTLDEARDLLAKSGLGISAIAQTSESRRPGTVLSQSPSAGTRVRLGAVVRLAVAAAPQPSSKAPNAAATTPPAADPKNLQLGVQGAGADRCAGIRDKAEQIACYEGTGAKAQGKQPAPPVDKPAQAVAVTGPPQWTSPPDLLALAMQSDGQRGVAVGTRGTLVVTTDGGQHWKAWRVGTADLRAVALGAEGKQIVIAGDDGARALEFEAVANGPVEQIRHSRQGGAMLALWRQGPAWIAVGRNGDGYFSADGQAWSSGPRVDGEFLAHELSGADRLVAVQRGTATRFLSAATTPPSWSERGALPDERVVALVQTAPGRVLAFTASGRSFVSTDGANRWERGPASVQGVRAAAVAAATTWAVGLDGAIDVVDPQGAVVPKTRGASGRLTAVAFDASDRRARNLWVAAASGWVLHSRDGGQTFRSVGRLPWGAEALEFETALRGRARNAAGEEWASEDGGASWSRREVPAAASATAAAASGVGSAAALAPAVRARLQAQGPVLATAQSADGTRLAAVGAAGLLLLGDPQRGGLTSPLAPYSRSAAPWTYPAALVALGLLAFAALVPPRPKEQSASVADMLASDKPLERVSGSDPLKLGPLSAGLARFLRNEATEPPLTIAVTGEWGSGKSSLMNLLAGELRRFGVSVVNFNAWHHQKEEHLLASLLTAVKNQAPPRWYGLQGLEFRWHLGVARARRAPVLTALLLFVLGAVVYLALNPGPLQPFADLVRRVVEYLANPSKGFDWDLSKIPEKILGASAFATAVASALAALRRLRAFGVDPAQLAATLAANFSLKDASAQASFRERFAREFREVTTAMRAGSRPRVLTIFIDDLDRCRPEAVLEVLEAVNFLVSSGDCYVVLGMARERVEACVGLAFEKVAVEMVRLSGEGADADADLARRKRREYARQYLEKLINVEVPMPVATIDQAQAIVGEGAVTPPRGAGPFALPAWVASIAGFWPLLVAAGLFAAGVIGAQWIVPSAEQAPAAAGPGPASSPRSADPPNAGPGTPVADAAAASQPGPGGSGELRDALDGSIEWLPLALLGAIAAVALAAAWLRRVDPVVRDSSQFRLALKIWLPVVVLRQNTPRAIKRFVNRVRYLAMLRGEPAPGLPDPGPLLVMLAAIEHADPAHLRDVAAYADGELRFAADPAAPASAAVTEAMRQHATLLAASISPQQFSDERRWFEENATSARIA